MWTDRTSTTPPSNALDSPAIENASDEEDSGNVMNFIDEVDEKHHLGPLSIPPPVPRAISKPQLLALTTQSFLASSTPGTSDYTSDVDLILDKWLPQTSTSTLDLPLRNSPPCETHPSSALWPQWMVEAIHTLDPLFNNQIWATALWTWASFKDLQGYPQGQVSACWNCKTTKLRKIFAVCLPLPWQHTLPSHCHTLDKGPLPSR